MKTKVYYVLQDKKSGKFFSAGNKVFWADDLDSARVYISAKQAKSSAGQHRCIQVDPDTNKYIGYNWNTKEQYEKFIATNTKYEWVNPVKIPKYELARMMRLVHRETGAQIFKTEREAIDQYNQTFRNYGYKPEWQVHEVTANIAITAVNV